MAIYAGFSIVLYYWLLLATTVAFEQNNLWAWFLMNLGAFALGTLLWLLLAARYAVTQEWRDRLGRVYRVGLVSCSFLGVSLLLLSLATLIVGTPPTWIESTTSMLLMIILTVVLVPPLLFLWGFIVCTPTLALIAYGGVSVYLFYYAWKDAKGQFSLGRIFIVTAWLAALLSLWRVTVMWAFGG